MKDPQGEGRPTDLWIGRQLGSYRLAERIGRGGQGVVYRAEHAQLAGVMAAIKVLRSDAPDDLGAGRLQREAMALQRLNHPHVVRFLDYGIEDEHQWLAMDFIDGESLWARVHRDGPLAPDEAVRVVGEVLDALGAAHDLGLLHRDIKLENVLFQSGDGRALLTDFGLAKGSTLGPSLSASGLIYGTPTYIPPEVWEGERADERSDLWSMGVLACHLATGELPFHISDARAASHVVCTKSPDLSRLTDPGLRHFVSRCLAKRRDRRPESAAAAKALLEGGFTGREVMRPRSPATAWSAGVAAVLVITAVTLGAWRPWEADGAGGGSDGGASGPPKLAGASDPQGTPSGDGPSADPTPPANRPVDPVPASGPEEEPPEEGPLEDPLAALNRRFQDARDAAVARLLTAVSELASALDDPSGGRARLQEFDALAAALACGSERDWITARQALVDRIAALEKPPEPDVRVLDWAETVVALPDPKIVTSPDLRGRIEATGLPWKVRGKGSGIELVLVPPGEYLRGASSGDDMARDDERPRHRVKITKAFYLGVTEVTNAQYRRKVRDHDSTDYKGVRLNDEAQPAVYVSWTAAQAFCEAFDGLRLPTEGEWEYAARACGEIATRYPWGDEVSEGSGHGNLLGPRSKRKFEFSWVSFPFDDAYDATGPVAQFRANALGLHDVTGNVWEWCSDWCGSDEYGRYGARPAEDPEGPETGEWRALRGGSWYDRPASARLSDRSSVAPDFSSDVVGFRVARTP